MFGTRQLDKEHYGRKTIFYGPGVERQPRPLGLVYGSEDVSSVWSKGLDNERRLKDDKSSWERLKLRRQQRDAEEDMQSYHQAKEREKQQSVKDKREDLQLLKNYNPWGKPAAGAPRWTPSGAVLAKRTAAASREGDTPAEGGYAPFGRPGGGAPLGVQDGRLMASLKAHPDIRFQQHLKKEVDNSLRYKDVVERSAPVSTMTKTESEAEREAAKLSQQRKYAGRLEEQRKEAIERKRQAREEARLSQQRRYAGRLEEQRKEAIERKRQAREDAVVPLGFPWGSDGPQRDESGKVTRHKRPVEEGGQHTPDFVSIAEQMQRVSQTSQSLNIPSPDAEAYHPWGKPGSGAPLVRNGHILTTVFGRCEGERQGRVSRLDGRRSKEIGHNMLNPITGTAVESSRHTDTCSASLPMTRLQREAELRHCRRRQWHSGGGEREGACHEEDCNQMNHGLKRTDNKREREGRRKRLYCEQLQQMMADREEQRRREKEWEIEAERKHVQVYAEQWRSAGRRAAAVKQPLKAGEQGPQHVTSSTATQ